MRSASIFKFVFWLIGAILFSNDKVDAQIRGQTTSGACPYSCKSIGLSKDKCREWKIGKRCFVEDLSKIDPTSLINNIPLSHSSTRKHKPKQTLSPEAKRRLDIEACHKVNPYYLVRPKIVLYTSTQPKELFGGKFKVVGAIEGNCLQTAYFFENGEKKNELQIETSRTFKRFRFEIVTDESLKPEIRVITINGERVIRKLKREESRIK